MTFIEIVSAVLDEVGYASSGTQADVLARVKRRVNEWHRRLLSTPGLVRFLRESYSVTFTSESGVGVYGLPPAIGRINGIWDEVNDIKLEQRSLTWLRDMDAGLSSGGTPEVYIPLAISRVRVQPSDASTLYVKSSSASDITTKTATIRYLDSTGTAKSATVTLTGTTAVAIGANVVEVHDFALNATTVGDVTLHEDSGTGTELARIAPGQVVTRYLRIQLWPTPQGPMTYRIDATRESTDLVANYDEPLLPRDFHHLLVLGALADEFRMRDDTRYETVRIDMEAGKRDLTHWIWNNVDYTPVGRRAARPSRLGAGFPAGS